MSGLTNPIRRCPTGVVVHSKSRVLELQYANGETYRVPFELLRVYSPSAEVQGHGPGQETLQTGKRDVTIIGRSKASATTRCSRLSPTATTPASIRGTCCTTSRSVRMNSGADYLAKLEAAGVDRDAPMTPNPAAAHGH